MNKTLNSLMEKAYFLVGSFCLVAAAYLLGINVCAAFTIIAFILYFMFSPALTKRKNTQDYLVLALLFVIFIFISKKIIEYNLPASYIPVVGLVMLVTALFNDFELTFLICIMSSVFAGILSGGSLFMTLVFLITGVIVGIAVWQSRRRMQIFSSGAYAGIIQMLTYMIVFRSSINDALPNLYCGVICGIAVSGILPIFENLFGFVTNISLLELSDFNHPLLKRLILEAPGTYHHSLIVGNLSEAAAESVGANALLARIGGYYHDIGKLANSEYFMENQQADSRHENLAASMSKMVIMNHVKEGVELAKKFRMKPAIIDFITQHHGTSLVYYFYRKALEEIDEKQVSEEGFRYSGPRPASKETAIVLLADSVEAASRIINDTQPAKIKELVHKIINNKFIDGQLDDCDLTLKDLEKIANVFIHMLTGIYHGRIKYPDDGKNIYKKHKPQRPAYRPGKDKEAPQSDN